MSTMRLAILAKINFTYRIAEKNVPNVHIELRKKTFEVIKKK